MNKLNKSKIIILIIIIIAILVAIGYFFIFNNNKVKNQDISLNSNSSKNNFSEEKKDENIVNNTEMVQQIDNNNIENITITGVAENKYNNQNLTEGETIEDQNDDEERERIKVHSFVMEKVIEDGRKIIEDKPDKKTEQTDTTNIQQDKPEDNKTPIIEYRVMFRTNGGSAIPSVYVEENKKVSKPNQNPTKNNTTFIDWFSDKELKTIYDFNTPITKNIILYAGWRADVDLSIITAVKNFKLKSTSINKNGHSVTVCFSNLNLDVLSMESSITGLFKDASNSNSYQSVFISYNGRGFDYLNYSEKTVPLRFIGWFGKDIWSGSYGFDCKSGDFIGKSFNIQVKLKDGYLSENNNKTENYQVSFVGG